ncbi:MAG: hypothetical protein HKN56_05540 [Gammaproteobacteria bacterium]|nr:hypothetical protein [Gammaproteobacteria bacterium]NND54419.1 hypothetical protein [Gammaproteobacteria bacterium]
MRFSSDPTEQNHIRAYEPGAIHLRDRTLSTNIIISAEKIIEGWAPAPLAEMSIADFSAAIEMRPDIILFGTGAQQVFPDIALLTAIMQQGIAIEVMQTHAACSTFNVLINEHRSAVAALLVD